MPEYTRVSSMQEYTREVCVKYWRGSKQLNPRERISMIKAYCKTCDLAHYEMNTKKSVDFHITLAS